MTTVYIILYTWLVLVPILCVKVVYNNCCQFYRQTYIFPMVILSPTANLITTNVSGLAVVVTTTPLCRFYGVYVQVSSARMSCALHLGYHHWLRK